MKQYKFKTEVDQLLNLITHSLYSHREIFLRELVSNSSDALDKLNYLVLTDEAYKQVEFAPRIDIEFDEEKSETITIRDTGLGMDNTMLQEQLGTIARSGTKNFLAQIEQSGTKDSELIGQFGVGFYSAFMVAEKVEVYSRTPLDSTGWCWTSEGKSQFSIKEAEMAEYGTRIVIFLNEENKEFASRWRIEEIVKRYADHIRFPIYLHYSKKEYDNSGKVTGTEKKEEQINSAAALWKRPKRELKDEDYIGFYQSLGYHGDEEPLFWLHTQAEGTLEYTTLFFVPRVRPHDLFQVDYKSRMKLYVKRVFITDDNRELLPSWLRFLSGVIDSDDLPLNVSREILQQNKVLSSITTSSIKRILAEIKKLSESNLEKFHTFVEMYNRLLKEGLYQDFANRDTLLELIRYKSTYAEGWVSLSDYESRMKQDQKAIYYLVGEDENVMRHSPLLESYRAQDLEVLLMDDTVDELVLPAVGKYKEKDFVPINTSDAPDAVTSTRDRKKEHDAEAAVEKIKKSLGDRVHDVVVSVRLTASPSCIVVEKNEQSLKLQSMLRAMGQLTSEEKKPILEINPNHVIIRALNTISEQQRIDDISAILLEQALILENLPITNPSEFTSRLNRVLTDAVSSDGTEPAESAEPAEPKKSASAKKAAPKKAAPKKDTE